LLASLPDGFLAEEFGASTYAVDGFEPYQCDLSGSVVSTYCKAPGNGEVIQGSPEQHHRGAVIGNATAWAGRASTQ